MSGWNNSPVWNNPYGYPNAGGGFGGANFNSPRPPHPGMYNMWGPYGGNQMGMVSQTKSEQIVINHFLKT